MLFKDISFFKQRILINLNIYLMTKIKKGRYKERRKGQEGKDRLRDVKRKCTYNARATPGTKVPSCLCREVKTLPVVN